MRRCICCCCPRPRPRHHDRVFYSYDICMIISCVLLPLRAMSRRHHHRHRRCRRRAGIVFILEFGLFQY